jgi:hypothetical protein
MKFDWLAFAAICAFVAIMVVWAWAISGGVL